jgi:hypothetical protein
MKEGKQMENNNSLKAELYTDVIKFNKEVICTEQPKNLKLLDNERLKFGVKVLQEETDEFQQAHLDESLNTDEAIAESIDALIDLIYFAFGRMYEMGLTPQQFANCWSEVHEKNMQKKKGNKGRGSDQDAIKPEGWEKPCVNTILANKAFNFILEDFEKDSYEFLASVLHISREEAKKITLGAGYPGGLERTMSEIGWVKEKPQPTFTMADIPKPLQECAELRKKKAADYQGSSIQLSDYFPFKKLSYTQMLWTKMLRLRSLVEDNKTPKNESIRDTLLDMINYTTFMIEALDKGEV